MTKAEKTRQFIIEKAAPLFNTRGVAGTAMSDIMDATKLAKGSLYVHFQDKDELAHCAVDYNLDSFLKKLGGAIGKHAKAKDKLLAVLDFLGDPLHPPVAGGCPMLNFGMEADDTDPIILRKVQLLIEGIQQNTAAIVREGIASGEFKKDWNPEAFALRILALMEGGILISRVCRSNKHMDVIVEMIKSEINAQEIEPQEIDAQKIDAQSR